MKLKILPVGRQYKVVIQEDGVRKEMELNAGDMYCIPQKNTSFQFDLRFNWVGYRAQTCWSICGWTTMVL
jgi:hypothetical protein